MKDFLTALALLLVIEGAIYSLFPEAAQRMMRRATELPVNGLRYGGLAIAGAGVLFAWIVRG